MPLDPSISLQTQQPNPGNLISGFLDLGLKKTALERQRATLESDIAQSQAESRRANTEADVAAQTAAPRVSSAQSSAETAAIGAKRAQTQLTKEQVQPAFDQASALSTDPTIIAAAQGGGEKAVDAATVTIAKARRRAIASGTPEDVAEVMFGHLTAELRTSPQTLPTTLQNIMKGSLGAQGQASTMYPAPALANNGQQTVPIASGNPAMTGVPAGTPQGVPIQMQVPPTSFLPQAGPVDVRGNPTVIQRNPDGSLVQSALPQAAQGGVQPLQIPPGENADTYKQLSGEREAARTTVIAAPTVHKLNGEILAELEKATTGQYSGIIAKGESVAGMLGVSLSGKNDAERAASAYDLVDKYTTMAATRAAQSMGNDTATALNAQLKQNASVERNPTAIRKSIKLNDAILSGAEGYQRGLEASIQSNPQADIFVKRKFDQAWAQNFDPVIFQLYQAQKSGDAAELSDLKKSLGNRAPEIMRKAANIQNLMTRGVGGG